jgi:hypothetical protein
MVPGLSPYHFGFNSPVRYNDPLGLMGQDAGIWGTGDTYASNNSQNPFDFMPKFTRTNPGSGNHWSDGNISGNPNDQAIRDYYLLSGSEFEKKYGAHQSNTVIIAGSLYIVSNTTKWIEYDGVANEKSYTYETLFSKAIVQSSGGSDGGSVSGALGWAGVGLGVVEEGANLVKSSQTVVVPVYNEAGKAIAGWNVIFKQTGQVIKYVKAGASKGGYVLAGASVGFDAVDYANGDLSGARFSYHTLGTAAATGAAIYGTAGIGALVGGTFIMGEHAYDLWMQNIQPQINQGFSDFYNGLRSGWRPFR